MAIQGTQWTLSSLLFEIFPGNVLQNFVPAQELRGQGTGAGGAGGRESSLPAALTDEVSFRALEDVAGGETHLATPPTLQLHLQGAELSPDLHTPRLRGQAGQEAGGGEDTLQLPCQLPHLPLYPLLLCCLGRLQRIQLFCLSLNQLRLLGLENRLEFIGFLDQLRLERRQLNLSLVQVRVHLVLLGGKKLF